ncbi:MAG TPA: FAD-dependent monooxygenase [Aliidongia sp.]|uniref:FAD-dependent monooxygenase n=1 Tax=Aliidongia sp. TaxID=1914230 RepID=UPI002DDD7358|nr:FAD-dependent monooxygenase [Aliidongia sp.]HEV2676461.1 FAD-dependent monooxygenase [Aliidongia sp.]
MATDVGGEREADVIVVGAGPAGLTAAAELARHGIRVRVVDKSVGPTLHSRASVVHVRTQEMLSAMGLADRFVARAYPLQAISLHAFGKFMGGIRLSGADSAYPVPRIIGQHVTERLLLERLDECDVPIERGVEATGYVDDGDRITLSLKRADGSEYQLAAPYVIAAEGPDSRLRAAAQIPFEGERGDGFEFLQSDCEVRWSYPSGRGYLFVTKDRFLGLFPFDADGAYRIVCARADQDPDKTEPPDLEELEAILREIADPDATLVEPRWLNRLRGAPRLAKQFRSGRLFLVGDTAHTHLPIGGQGMNSGMQDGFNLGWKLAAVLKGEAQPALLDSYGAERLPVAEDLLKFTDRGFHSMVKPGDLAQRAMKLFGASVMGLESVQERLRRTVGEVPISYLTSALSEDHGGTIGPIAGERAPDGVAVRAADRRTVRLLQAITGEAWTLLIFAGLDQSDVGGKLAEIAERVTAGFGPRVRPVLVTPDRPPASWPGEVLIDRDQLLHDRYGVRHAALYLLRPDWYVGFRAPAVQAELLEKYLARWLVPAAAPVAEAG